MKKNDKKEAAKHMLEGIETIPPDYVCDATISVHNNKVPKKERRHVVILTESLIAVSALLILSFIIWGVLKNKKTEPENKPIESSEDEPATESAGTKVSVDGSHGSITLNVPETWNWETTKGGGKLQTGTIGSYGIILKPGEAKQGQIEVFYTNAFGLCGTGLFSKKMTLAKNPVWVYTYDGSKNWNYIVFDNDSPKIVVCHTDCSMWTDEMWDEAWSILDTISY